MAEKNPFFKFFPGDWRSDPRLRMCGPAARGFWMDLLCLMHEATPYGHLVVNGVVPTDTQLSMLTATPPDMVADLLAELELTGVFSRNGKGIIYSRKMVRDEKKRRTARENGKNGGNPSLCKDSEIIPSDNQKANPYRESIFESPDKKGDTNVSPKKETPAEILSAVLGKDLAAEVVKHRQRKRAPLTPKAATLLRRKFERCHDPTAGAELMIERGWQGFEPEWLENASRVNGKADDKSNRILRMADGLDQRAQAHSEVDRGEDDGPTQPLLPAAGGRRH